MINIKKMCIRCKKSKDISCFCLDNSRKDLKSPICNQCNSEKSKIWRKKNKEHCKEKAKNYKNKKECDKNYRIRNREKIREKKKLQYLQNREKIMKRSKLRYERTKVLKIRVSVDKDLKKLSRRISCGIWRSLKGIKNNKRWEGLVGYTVDELKTHLEKQFTIGMAWDNYGKWHVDHKIPISAFNFKTPDDIDFKRCWELKNLQPLWKFDNLSKHDKLPHPFQPSLALNI